MQIINECSKSINKNKTAINDIKRIINHIFLNNISDVKYSDIGKGGNGIVFKIENGEDVFCLKYLNVYKNMKKRIAEKRRLRFENEIKIMQKLDHKNILKIKAINLNDNYYTMPLAERYNVNRYSELKDKLNDCLLLADAIKYIHDNNTVHRDIKLSNILIYDGTVKLSDFGIAKDDDFSEITDIGEKVGPANISPNELLRSHNLSIEKYKKSDVYLFSKVVWQIIKEDEYGFPGSYYDYIDDENYINLEYCKRKFFNEKVLTIEPINELIIKSTNANLDERIDINKCIGLLTNEINILDSNLFDNDKSKNKDIDLNIRDNALQIYYSTSILAKNVSINKNIVDMLYKCIQTNKIEVITKGINVQPIKINTFIYNYENNKFSFTINDNLEFIGISKEIKITNDFSIISLIFDNIIIEDERYKKFDGKLVDFDIGGLFINKYYFDYISYINIYI